MIRIITAKRLAELERNAYTTLPAAIQAMQGARDEAERLRLDGMERDAQMSTLKYHYNEAQEIIRTGSQANQALMAERRELLSQIQELTTVLSGEREKAQLFKQAYDEALIEIQRLLPVTPKKKRATTKKKAK